MTTTPTPQRSPFQFNEELYEKLKLLKTTDQADKGALVRECIELLRKHQQKHELPAAPAVAPDEILIPRATLKWWRELVDLNPKDLAPRIQSMLDGG